jgi:hypothetical protein
VFSLKALMFGDFSCNDTAAKLYLLWQRGCVIVSDIDHYVIIITLLDRVFNIFCYSKDGGEFKHT